MSKVILLLALAALTFTATKSASNNKEDKQDSSRIMDMMKKEYQDSVKMLMETMKECNETFTIENSYLQSLNESGSFPDETERTPKCYIRCLLEKLGVATEEGQYDPSKMAMVLQLIRPDSDSSSFDDTSVKCNERKETCKCDRAYQYVKCAIQEDIMRNSS